MLTVSLLLFGAVLLALALADTAVRRLPLTPAVIYLLVGWAAGAVLGVPPSATLTEEAPLATVVTEFAVLVSLFAVGLRLRAPAHSQGWKVALLLAGPGMVVTVGLAAAAAMWLLHLPWPLALLLAGILAPTDPVLASEVQIRSEEDRDAVRLSLTGEGGLNDATALPAVMLALGLLGLNTLGPWGRHWWADDLLWPIGCGALLGMALGRLLGLVLKVRLQSGDKIARDELLYVSAVALAYGLARATSTSTFIVAFAAGATLRWPLAEEHLAPGAQALTTRLQAFGAAIERLVEAATVLGVGIGLHSVHIGAPALAFGLVLVCVVRPLSVLAVVRRRVLPTNQRRLVAWFGIRGIGSLYYLAFALQRGVAGSAADELVAAALVAIALSILLHGVSATPLMSAYHRRRGGGGGAPKPPPG